MVGSQGLKGIVVQSLLHHNLSFSMGIDWPRAVYLKGR